MPILAPLSGTLGPLGYATRRADYVSEVMSDGPVGYWRLSESAGPTAADSAGSNAGTYASSGITYAQAAIPGASDNGAILLNGTTGKVDIPNAVVFQLSNGTIECWFKGAAPGSGFRALFLKSNAYALFIVNGAAATYDFGANQLRTSGVSVSDGAWHHVALTFQSGVASGTKVWVDGVDWLTTTTSVLNQTIAPAIGHNTGVQFLAGTVDEAAIYSTVLSTARIQAHYNKGRVA